MASLFRPRVVKATAVLLGGNPAGETRTGGGGALRSTRGICEHGHLPLTAVRVPHAGPTSRVTRDVLSATLAIPPARFHIRLILSLRHVSALLFVSSFLVL